MAEIVNFVSVKLGRAKHWQSNEIFSSFIHWVNWKSLFQERNFGLCAEARRPKRAYAPRSICKLRPTKPQAKGRNCSPKEVFQLTQLTT